MKRNMLAFEAETVEDVADYKADYISTFSGIRFTPLAPDPEQLNINDIARSLSMLCRAGGHLEHFYSVAQHCIICANEAKARGYSKRVQLACLMHDGSEAYLSDITRPVKKHLPKYLAIEENLQKIVYQHYLKSPLTPAEELQVNEIDDAVLPWEFKEIMGRKDIVEESLSELKSNPNFRFRDFGEVEQEFLSLFESLSTLI